MRLIEKIKHKIQFNFTVISLERIIMLTTFPLCIMSWDLGPGFLLTHKPLQWPGNLHPLIVIYMS